MFCSKIAHVLRVIHAGARKDTFHWAWVDRVLMNCGG